MRQPPKSLVKTFETEVAAISFAKNFLDQRGLARFGCRLVQTTYNHPLDGIRTYTVTVAFAASPMGRKLAAEWSK